MDYLSKIDLNFTESIKNKLRENIKNISIFKKYVKSMLPTYSLNDFYKIYNDYNDFKKLLIENIKSDNKDWDETALKGFSVIFDINKISMPLYYSAFYEMQRTFWEMVVIGGLLADMKLSAYLDSIKMSLLSSTLNNFAAVSSSYNVIKPYNFKIKIINDDYKFDENIE